MEFIEENELMEIEGGWCIFCNNNCTCKGENIVNICTANGGGSAGSAGCS